MTYTATRCPCGHRACKAWHVDGAGKPITIIVPDGTVKGESR